MSLIFFLISNSFILCKIQGFQGLLYYNKIVLGGSRGGRSYFYGITTRYIDRASLYIENCKPLPIWIATGL